MALEQHPRAPRPDEVELFDAARALLDARHDPSTHQVAAAARTEDGRIHLGMHLGSRRINICAESTAISNARMISDSPIVAMVAVCKDDGGRTVVTNPCGVCRELMGQYLPDAFVLVDVHGDVGVVPSASLLPLPWMFPRENDWDGPTPNADQLSETPNRSEQSE